jgi:RNase P subunit RPR2
MAVTLDKLDDAISEAERFLYIARKCSERLHKDRYAVFGCKETGAVRRVSMDLSNVLVKIRSSED